MVVCEVREPPEIEPEPRRILDVADADDRRVRVDEVLDRPEREGAGVLEDVGQPQLEARLLCEAPPHVRHAREVDVDRDHVGPGSRSQPAGDLVEGLGRARRHGHVRRRAAKERGSGLAGALVRAGLRVVVEPDGSPPADRPLELLDDLPNRLGNERDRRRVQVRELAGGREVRAGHQRSGHRRQATRRRLSRYVWRGTETDRRVEEPLEPLTPSPYASVVYSVPRPANKVVPSNLGGSEWQVLRPCWRRSRGLAPPRSLPPRRRFPPPDPIGRSGPERTVATSTRRVNAVRQVVLQAVPSDVAGSGARTSDEERVTNDRGSIASRRSSSRSVASQHEIHVAWSFAEHRRNVAHPSRADVTRARARMRR